MNRGINMVLEVIGLNKSFREKQILKDINFQLKKGEILAIVGPSGAGKTTMLRCINGLETCDSGTINIDGTYLCKDYNGKSLYSSSKDIKTIRKKIGLVFQNYNLFPHMSVMENIIEAPINVYGIPKDKSKAKALELLNIMGLEKEVDSYPFQLSGGQKQRVAIARACALSPKIMCLDEPTSALDPKLREEIGIIIERLAENNMAIIIITHDMDFADRIAHRIILLDKGSIEYDGEKGSFFKDFQNDRIKKFMVL